MSRAYNLAVALEKKYSQKQYNIAPHIWKEFLLPDIRKVQKAILKEAKSDDGL